MRYRVHRIRDSARESFRWSPHTGGTAIVKLKDYAADEELEAATPYAAWKLAAELGFPLRSGDLLESGNPSQLLIAKYIGFEPAEWFTHAIRPEPTTGFDHDCPAAEPTASQAV